jgi:hypothetical protein
MSLATLDSLIPEAHRHDSGNGDHRDEPSDCQPEPASDATAQSAPCHESSPIPIRPRSGSPLLTSACHALEDTECAGLHHRDVPARQVVENNHKIGWIWCCFCDRFPDDRL